MGRCRFRQTSAKGGHYDRVVGRIGDRGAGCGLQDRGDHEHACAGEASQHIHAAERSRCPICRTRRRPCRSSSATGTPSLHAKHRQPRTRRPVDLGDAYGRMGMLLMAAEYRERGGVGVSRRAGARSPRPGPLAVLPRRISTGSKATRRSRPPTFERARALQPDDVPTLVWLGDALAGSGQAGRRRAAVHEGARDAAAARGRAVRSRTRGARPAGLRPGRGVSRERALSLDPQATIVHYPLALAYRGTGRHGEGRGAHAAARHARDQAGRSADARARQPAAQRARVRGQRAPTRSTGRTGRPRRESFRKGIALAPDEPSLHHKLGTALALQGRTRGAVEQFEQALAGRRSLPRPTTASA